MVFYRQQMVRYLPNRSCPSLVRLFFPDSSSLQRISLFAKKGLEEFSVKDQKHDTPVLAEGIQLVDSHCHLDMESYAEDLEDVLERARQHKVATIITIGVDPDSSKKAVRLAQQHPEIWASAGIHPHDLLSVTDSTYTKLFEFIEANREWIVGYGEIGLDYAKQRCEPGIQRRHFQTQLDMAKNLKLPVIIHDREAHEDTLRLLRDCGPFPAGGVMHCFSGDYHFARKILDLGFSISIPGIVTFKNAADLRKVAVEIPLASLLLETDGPYLAPHPWRGRRNEPSYVLHTAACVAELRGISLSLLARATTANAVSLFDLHRPKQPTELDHDN